MTMNRRDFLKQSGAFLSLASLGGMTAALSGLTKSAQAAQVSDYKALVGVFLLGGMDNHDTVIPYDQSAYDRYAQIRSSLLSQYTNNSRARANLLALSPSNSANFLGRSFALPPELSGIHGLFQQGQAAIVGNVGPLLQTTTRQGFELETAKLPARLFSHNDQQATWMSSSPEGARYGWGGFFADALLSNNTSPEFSAITSGGNELFLTGQHAIPYQVGLGGRAQAFTALENLQDQQSTTQQIQLLQAHLRGDSNHYSHLIAKDMANKMTASFDSNVRFNQSLTNAPTISTTFPTNELGQQLQAVAKTISIRNELQAKRQVFLVGLGGFDTHSRQAQALPMLHKNLDIAVTAFQQAMMELGLHDKVTLFTMSDFGRALSINGDGTDHGWGGHQFVIGGAVNGGQIYGDLPIADFNHDQDAGNGRLIPTTSVEQFAAPLGHWFGLSDSELQTALPNLSNFSNTLRFV